MKIIAVLFFLSACQTAPKPEPFCFRGIVFMQTASGMTWVPDLDGRPVACIDYFMDVPEVQVPEEPKQ